MGEPDKKITIAKIGLATSVIMMATTIIDKLSGFITGRPELPGTNAPGDKVPGTNAAAEPLHAVPGNTPMMPVEINKAPEGLVMPWHWVIIILCLLVALACVLIWKKIKRRHKIAQDQRPR
jgi:hypothetical protein